MSCPDCFSGHVHEGDVSGEELQLHGLHVYATGPQFQDAKGIIVIIPDAFGWKFINSRLWADEVAKRGSWRVLLPDFMHGHSADPRYIDTMPKLLKRDSVSDYLWKPYYVWRAIYGFGYFSFTNQVKYAWPRVQSFFTALRTDSESLKLPVGAAGFCWGGLYAIRLTHSTSVCEIGDSAVGKGSILKPLVDASFMAHPQPLVWPTDAENISRPMSAAIGDRDWCTSVAKIEELERIFQARNDAGVPAEVVMYKGAGHGFAVRYDPGNPNLVTQAQQAQDQAISFFQQHFSQT